MILTTLYAQWTLTPLVPSLSSLSITNSASLTYVNWTVDYQDYAVITVSPSTGGAGGGSSFTVTGDNDRQKYIGTATAGVTYVAIPYVETITSTSSSTFIVDEIVDKPSSSAIFYTGSATITDATRTNVTISDPTYLASEASLSPRPIHFIGPFQGSSARTVILRYKMWLPANGSTYSNTAYALIGDQSIGSSASAIPKVKAIS